MKSAFLISIFVVIHILFIFAYIHKHNCFIEASYLSQKMEQKKLDLLRHGDSLRSKLCHMKDLKEVKEFAIKKLKMKSLNLSDIRKLKDD